MMNESTDSTELTFNLEDVAATERLGAALAGVLPAGMLIFLQGDLGAGKTCLVRGVLRKLGHQGAVKSPTYTLLEEYSLSGKKIVHFDLYRLTDPEELDLIGIRDYFDGEASCFIEWPQRGEGYLPTADVVIQIVLDGHGRSAIISACSESGKKMLEFIQTELCQEFC